MNSDDTEYELFHLKNKEFTFDVDVSNLPCGLNGVRLMLFQCFVLTNHFMKALYFVSMSADGGQSEYANNAAGAKYGTGYCDAQCPQDIKFINGQVSQLYCF